MKRISILMVAIVMMVLSMLPAWGAAQYTSGLRVGSGGFLLRNGDFEIQDYAQDTTFSVAKTTGNFLTVGTFGMSLVNAASGSANPFDFTGTLGIMNGSDDFTLFDVNITNANHTSTSNTVQVLDIAAITGDADATETAIKIGAGWDSGITCTSPAILAVVGTVADATATRVCTSADYGKTIFLSYEGAVAVTLPANAAAAGSVITFIVIGSNTCDPTISAATVDTLITVNDATADSVSFATGHRIGAAVMVISTGTVWVAINLGSTTMTVNT